MCTAEAVLNLSQVEDLLAIISLVTITWVSMLVGLITILEVKNNSSNWCQDWLS